MHLQAIRNVVDATARFGKRDHVYKRPRGIRDVHTRRASPDRLDAEVTILWGGMKQEGCPLRNNALMTNPPGREHDGFIEELFG